jgi:hypothetical protein
MKLHALFSLSRMCIGRPFLRRADNPGCPKATKRCCNKQDLNWVERQKGGCHPEGWQCLVLPLKPPGTPLEQGACQRSLGIYNRRTGSVY